MQYIQDMVQEAQIRVVLTAVSTDAPSGCMGSNLGTDPQGMVEQKTRQKSGRIHIPGPGLVHHLDLLRRYFKRFPFG